jgi:hypothetical protein
MKPPNEKLVETLFTHHALRYLDGTGATVYTPSSREEYRDGYDARLGFNSFDEIYLQFKTPNLLAGDGYSLATYERQHQRLQKYRRDTAYYLTHLFRGVDHVLQAQREASAPLDFLHWYVAIEIGGLADVQRFRYYADLQRREANVVLFKVRTDRKGDAPKTRLHEQGWMTGAELLERFKRDEVGTHFRLIESGSDRLTVGEELKANVVPMSPDLADEWVQGDEGKDWGTALRKNLQPAGGVAP